MARKSVGYFEGTDSGLLTSLIVSGYDTLPVSNGVDRHGRSVYRITDKEKYDLLIGYLHKLYHPVQLDLPYQKLFRICSTYQIPLLIMVPETLRNRAEELMPEKPSVAEFVDPAQVLERALQLLAMTD